MAPRIGRVVLDWQRWQNPPTRIVVGIGGVATGPAGGPLVPHLFLGPDRAEDAHWFARTYAPFRARMAHGELVFHGQGRVRPGAVEQRMILEWARRLAAELAGGRSGSVYGLALSWHRGESVGSCESVSVFLTGEARAQSCAWGEDEVRGRLHPAAAGRVYGWFAVLHGLSWGAIDIHHYQIKNRQRNAQFFFEMLHHGSYTNPALLAFNKCCIKCH